MRMLDTLPEEEQARRFGNYLVGRGMPNQVEPGGGGWALWIVNDDHLEPARAELAAFRDDPQAERYRGGGLVGTRVRPDGSKQRRKSRAKYVDVRTSWASMSAKGAPVTMFLLGACIVVGLLTKFGTDRNADLPVQNSLFLSHTGPQGPQFGLDLILHGQIWRLFTPMFVHFGPIHLLFNMLWLVDLGGRIERTRSSLWFVGFILLSAALSNLAEHFFDIGAHVPEFIGISTAKHAGGMSGVVYALFGYCWARSRIAPYELLHLANQTKLLMIAWLIFCMTGAIGQIANVAHLAGMIIGAAVPYAAALIRRAGR